MKFAHWIAIATLALCAAPLYGGCGCCGVCANDMCLNSCVNDCSGGCADTFFAQREQDANQWLYMALDACKQHTHYDSDTWTHLPSITIGCERSMKNDRVSSYFLTPSGVLHIGPDNAVTGLDNKINVRASDLGLPPQMAGRMRLHPHINSVYTSFNWYGQGCNRFKGVFSWIYIPFVHTTWTSCLTSEVDVDDTGPGDSGHYYNPTAIAPHVVAKNEHYVVDHNLAAVDLAYTDTDAISDALVGDDTFGDAPALKSGKLRCCDTATDGLSGIRLGIGYDFLRKERGNMGIGVELIAPAANKPGKNLCCYNDCPDCNSPCASAGTTNSDAVYNGNLYYFMPSTGGQHAWKFGGVLRGQYKVYEKNPDNTFTLYFDGRTHAVFNSRSTRLLGLNLAGTTSFNHWLLLKKYTVLNIGAYAQYNSLERAANLLRAYVTMKTGVEGEITLMGTWTRHGFVGSLGYNFFGRRAECAQNWCLCNRDALGDTYKYVIKANSPVAAESGLTLYDGGFYSKTDTNIYHCGTQVAGSQVVNVPRALVINNAIDFAKDLDVSMALHPTYLSHTVFGSFGYSWLDVDWQPAVGVIGKLEFGQRSCTMRNWGAFVEGSLSF